MVGLDGVPGGDAGHDGLGAAGIAGEIVIFNVAQTDSPVGLRHHPRDVHRGSRPGDAHTHAVGRLAVHAGDFVPRPFPCQLSALFGGVLPVGAQGEHQRDILPPDTGGIQLVQQRGHDFIGRHGAGDVTGDDGHLFPGVHQLPQAGGFYGRLQRPANLRLTGQLQRNLVGMEHAQQIFFRNLHGLHPGSEAEFQHHGHQPFLPSTAFT